MTKKVKYDGMLFWIFFLIISFSVFLYTGIWGLQNDNARAGIISGVFGSLIVMSLLIIVTFGRIFDKRYSEFKLSYSKSCFFFSIGFLIWLLIGSLSKSMSVLSVLSLPQNTLYASISGQLPRVADVFFNVVSVPFSEELFWGLALPILILWILLSVGKKVSFFRNVFVQFFIIGIIASSTFAIFHAGQSSIMFFVSAIIFRTLLLVLSWGDVLFNSIPYVTMLFSFILGAHIGNNMVVTGLSQFFLVMLSAGFVGVLFLLFFAQLFFFGFVGLFEYLGVKR